MKKNTKKFLIIASIVTAAAGVLFGSASAYNAHVEKQNENYIAEVKREKEQAEKQKQNEIDAISYSELQTYEREKIYNNKTVDFSQFTVPTTLFTENENYVSPLRVFYSTYKNFQTNKHLYVYLDSNLTQNEKQSVKAAIDYINTVVHTIDPQYSVTITDTLGDTRAYIRFTNDPYSTSSFLYGNALGITEIYEEDSPLFNKPVVIHMQTDYIAKYGQNVYDKVYKSTAIHEFLHAAGLDHPGHDNEDELHRPIMCAKSNTTDYLSIPELAELFGWLNQDKYTQAQNNGTLQEVCNNDFKNYLNLIEYSINQSMSFSNYSQKIETDQVVRVQYDETPNDGIDNKTTLTFNYPFANFCEKLTPKEDGTVERTIRPFISAKGKMIILNEDCKHYDEKDFNNATKVGSYEYKTNLTYDEVMQEIKTMEPKNGYEITNSFDIKVNHYEYETQNLWQKLTNTSTKQDVKILEALYNISYLYTWKIGDFSAEETTNNFDKNLLQNRGDDYAKN